MPLQKKKKKETNSKLEIIWKIWSCKIKNFTGWLFLVPGRKICKSLEFPKWQSYLCCSWAFGSHWVYANEVTSGKLLDNFRIGAGHQKHQTCDYKVGILNHLDLWVWELEIELITWPVINPTYMMKSQSKLWILTSLEIVDCEHLCVRKGEVSWFHKERAQSSEFKNLPDFVLYVSSFFCFWVYLL